MVEKGEETVADEVGGRLEPGGEQQDRSGDDLIVAERVTGLAGGNQARQQVVRRRTTTFGDQVEEVGAHLIHRRGGGVQRGRVGGRVQGRGPGPHERLETRPVRSGDADQLADDGDRQRERQRGHDVDLACVEHVVQVAGDHCFDRRPQPVDPVRGERPADQAAEPGVVRRVGKEHVVPGPLEERLALLGVDVETGEPERRPLPRRPQRRPAPETRVAQRGHAVLVAAQHDRPEAAAQHRGGVAQLAVERVGVGSAFGGEQQAEQDVVSVNVTDGGHQRFLTGRRGPSHRCRRVGR